MKYFEILYRQGPSKKKIVLEAENRLDAMQRFQSKTLGIPLQYRETSQPLGMRMQKYMEKRSSPLKNKRIAIEPYISTLRQVAVMLDAGLPINICIDESVKAIEDPMLKHIFTSVKDDIEGGNSLTQALRPFERQLGNLSISMVHLGEQTGSLSESINTLADILQEIQDNRTKLKRATRYPMFTIFAMAIAFTVVLTFVVPQFEELFAQSGAQLPFPTRFLLWVEHALIDFGPYIVSVAALMVALSAYFYRKNEGFALFSDKMLLKVYIVGQVTHFAMIGRFVYIFNVLNNAGLPITESIKAAVGVVDNRFMKQQLNKILEAIEGGRSLYDGFNESNMFVSMILQMLKAGEDSGALNTMLTKITAYYQKRYAAIIDNVSSMIEPLLIAAIAGFVLVLALGIFLPMWKMAEAMGL